MISSQRLNLIMLLLPTPTNLFNPLAPIFPNNSAYPDHSKKPPFTFKRRMEEELLDHRFDTPRVSKTDGKSSTTLPLHNGSPKNDDQDLLSPSDNTRSKRAGERSLLPNKSLSTPKQDLLNNEPNFLGNLSPLD